MIVYLVLVAISLWIVFADLKAEKSGAEPKWRSIHISNLCFLAVVLALTLKAS